MHLAMDRLCLALLNTATERPDPLETPLGAARWWAGHGVPLAGKPRFDPALSAALRDIRAAVQAQVSGRDAAIAAQFRGDASDAILFEVLHAVRAAAAAGTLHRLRRCNLPACGRYFADPTKNGSKRWCSLRCMERARVPRRRTITR